MHALIALIVSYRSCLRSLDTGAYSRKMSRMEPRQGVELALVLFARFHYRLAVTAFDQVDWQMPIVLQTSWVEVSQIFEPNRSKSASFIVAHRPPTERSI